MLKAARDAEEFYEDRGARISILAGRRPPRRDTLKQTDQPPISAKPLADGAGHTFSTLAHWPMLRVKDTFCRGVPVRPVLALVMICLQRKHRRRVAGMSFVRSHPGHYAQQRYLLPSVPVRLALLALAGIRTPTKASAKGGRDAKPPAKRPGHY